MRVMEYDMEDQLQSALDLYRELVGTERPLKKVATPFRNTGIKNVASTPITTGPWLRCPWCKGEFDEPTFALGTGDPAKADGRDKAAKKLLNAEDIKKIVDVYRVGVEDVIWRRRVIW